MRMIRLCICDDNEIDNQQMKVLMESFMKEHPEYPIQVEYFISSYEVIEYINKFGGFDIYILDIIMPDVDGLQLARKIRERDDACEILFLTISCEYAIDAFQVKARNYLVKPIYKVDFDREVLISIRNICSARQSSLLLKTKEGYRKILLHELVMIEGFDHRQICTFSDGSKLETTVTLTSLYKEIKAYPCFYMPHRSYIINLDYVCGITAQNILFHGGKTIPVSRNVYNQLKRVLLDYSLSKSIS